MGRDEAIADTLGSAPLPGVTRLTKGELTMAPTRPHHDLRIFSQEAGDQEQWWTPGYPLLPQPYRTAWASEPLPSTLVESSGLPADATLGILDAEVWERVDHPRRLRGVAEHVARVFAQRVHRRPRSPLAQQPIASRPWPLGLDARQLPFSLRTRNLLERHGRLDDPFWLATASAADIGALRLCGPLTVLEVASLLERHLDPATEATTPPAPDSPPASTDLKVALAQVVRGVIAARNVPRMLRRLGWDGRGGCTLQTVAAEFGVTRERIRQIEAALLLRLHPDIQIPALDRAIEVLERAARQGECDAVEVLLRNGITSRPFLPQGVLTAAHIFGRSCAFEVNSDGRTIRQPIPPALAAAMFEAQLKLDEVNFIASVEEFLSRVEGLGFSADIETARQFLDRRQRLAWLDDDQTWFWIRQPSGRNRVEQAIKKVLSVCERISVDALARALARSHRTWPRPLPFHVLRGLCRAAGLVVHGNVISSPAPLDPCEILSPSERMLVDHLRAQGGLMQASDLRTEGGMASGTLSMLLAQSPLVERVEGGAYRLVGTTGGVSA